MRPPAAIFLGFVEVDFRDACTDEISGALFDEVSVRGCDKARAPEREVAFRAAAVCGDHERAVCNRVPAHDGCPAILLARVDFGGFGIHPADGGGVDEHVCALEAHDAGGFREPLVPANQYAKRTRACLDGLETRVARNKVILFVEGRVVGNVALAVEPCDASVALKNECGVVVDSAGALFEEREDDHCVQLFCNLLPFRYNRVVLFDGEVEEVCVFFEREIRRVEQFREYD